MKLVRFIFYQGWICYQVNVLLTEKEFEEIVAGGTVEVQATVGRGSERLTLWRKEWGIETRLHEFNMFVTAKNAIPKPRIYRRHTMPATRTYRRM